MEDIVGIKGIQYRGNMLSREAIQLIELLELFPLEPPNNHDQISSETASNKEVEMDKDYLQEGYKAP
ncbi:MAG: hypothetical protein ACMUEL_00115 [Flavobacteriales bacterium Tduv]